MVEHLSDDWIAAFDRIIAGHAGLASATADTRLVVEYTITAPELVSSPPRPAGGEAARADRGPTDRSYALVFDHGANHVVAGSQPEPDITLRTDARTAAAIASHVESAQAAFMAGRLRLGGDVRTLMAHQAVVAGIDDCAAALRADTEFPALGTPTAADA